MRPSAPAGLALRQRPCCRGRSRRGPRVVEPIRVLVAHPDAGLRSACRESLGGEGCEVASAGSGLECLSQLKVDLPDVLVLDVDLPWGGGDGVLAWLGEHG